MKTRIFSLLFLLSLMVGLVLPTSQVAANEVVLPENGDRVECTVIVECDYINLHNRPAEGFVTNPMFTPLPVSDVFEHQVIYHYIEMHTQPTVKVAGISIIIPISGGFTPQAAFSPLSTSPAFIQMPIYGYLEMHSH
jgi:hypothetical protein